MNQTKTAQNPFQNIEFAGLKDAEPTFDNLPKLVKALISEVFDLKTSISNKETKKSEFDQWFDLDGLVAYDPEKRGKPTFYGYVSRNEIPFHKRGKKLTFLKSEIDEWLKSGRVKTNAEIEAEALHLLNRESGRS